MLAALLPVLAAAQGYYDASKKPDGDGTARSPYQIATLHNLLWIAQQVNGGIDLADTYLASFAVRGDSLVLDRVFLSPFDEPTTPADLAPFGFAATGRMRIVSLSSDRLVLQSDAARLTFRKY